jgi:hypothetical protein
MSYLGLSKRLSFGTPEDKQPVSCPVLQALSICNMHGMLGKKGLGSISSPLVVWIFRY